MTRYNKNNRNIVKKIAKARMLYLFQKAHDIFPDNKVLANKYVYMARRYAQRTKIKIPYKWKKRICHKCKQFLYPGVNCRVRMHSQKKRGSHVSLTCLDCDNTTRYFIKTIRTKKEVSV